MKVLIAKRYSQNDNFENLVPLKPGMCITARVDDNLEFILPCSLPYPHFVYIVENISESRIDLIDTGHNNSWNLNLKDLESCELVSDFHSNVNEIDCEYINRVLNK